MSITYLLRYRLTGATLWTNSPSGFISATTDTISGLTPGLSYDFDVIANDGSTEAISTTLTASTVTTESTEGTTVTFPNTTSIIYASQTMGVASSGPFNQFSLTNLDTVSLVPTPGGFNPGGNVVDMVYHNHTLFMFANFGTGTGWWYWNTTLANWTAYNIGLNTPANTFFASNAGSGTTIVTVAPTVSDGSGFVGTLTVSDTVNFQVVGNTIQPAIPLTAASYTFTVTATPSVVGTPVTTQTITTTALAVTSLTLTNTTVPVGSPTATAIGTVNVTLNSGSFVGTLAVSDTTDFQFGANNLLETKGVLSNSQYPLNIIATQTSPRLFNSAFTQPFSITTTSVNTISNVVLNGTHAFLSGSSAGTVVGSITVSMGAGSFAGGTLSVNNANFAISGTNLVTVGVLSGGPYTNVIITATEAGATNSPFASAPVTITATPIVTAITLSTLFFPSQITTGTTFSTVGATMSDGSTFAGTFSTTNANFQFSGTSLQAGATLSAASYTGVVITATPSNGAPAFSRTITLTAITINSVTLSGSMTFTSGAPAGTVVGSASVVMNTGSFAGTLASNNANFTFSGNNLVTVGTLVSANSPWSVNVIATQTSPRAFNSPLSSTTYTITATVSSGLSRPFLIGTFNNSGTTSPTFSSYMGFAPDFSENGSFTGADLISGTGSATPSSYPVIWATSHIQVASGFPTQNNPTLAAAAGTGQSGGPVSGNYYDNLYVPAAAAMVSHGYAQRCYAIRINREWPLGQWDWCPFNSYSSGSGFTGTIPATLWVAGFRQMVTALRANPGTAHLKICWDYPLNMGFGSSQQQIALQYYPGDEYVDIISSDVYFFTNQGASSTAVWNNYQTHSSGESFGMQDWANFALNGSGWNGSTLVTTPTLRPNTVTNKGAMPMACPELGDAWNDGFCISHMATFMKTSPFVFFTYWDTDGALPSGQSTALNTNANTKSAFITAFGSAAIGTTYTGNYWPLPLYSIANVNVPGY